jgi:protein-S-isoprenylcysteine O-methyltransferase Ste14
MARAVFAFLLIAFPIALAVRIRGQRRALGRSPVILGKASDGPWAAAFERVGPFGLLFWPATWLWVVAGGTPLAEPPIRALGLVLLMAGSVFTLASIFLMGRAWRIGIDPDNRTDLAEAGPYRWVRHPIYGGWLVMLIGNVLAVPHPVIEIGAIVTTLGIVYQARREEQHLLRTFGERYARYAARTGRFAPRLWPRSAAPTRG